MYQKDNYKFLTFILIFISISSFFLGFYFDENSAGAGTYNGDFKNTWKNLQTFINNDLSTAINYTTSSGHEGYASSRTPALYIIHKLLNPFLDTKINYRRSVFIFSLLLPLLFYINLKQSFKENSNILLILIASTVCLSPYFRTSTFWGLEENYGLIFLLLSFLTLNNFLKSEKSDDISIFLQLFLTTFFSSLCLYFDQKLIIIPIICFASIVFSKKKFKLKIFAFFSYFIFSIPYIYLITLWGNLLPTADAGLRKIGTELFFGHIGYLTTIIAFYFVPLLFFKKKKFYELVKDFFSNKKNYFLISLFFIYLFYLINFFDFVGQPILGKGFIHKSSIILIKSEYIRQIFTYFSFFVSWIIILIFLENNYKDFLIILYFYILSIVIWPLMQEYFDPLIILMAFTFFNNKLYINYKNSIFLFVYLSTLLIFSNIYYIKLLG